MRLQGVETFYPLTPLQQGLLFHSLAEPTSGLYFNQTTATLGGDLDTDAFRAAWQHVVDEHPVLRTFFVWEEVKAPVQVVKEEATMPFEVLDWRELSSAESDARFESLRQADLERGFDLAQAPLMRATVVRVADDRHRLLWSFHHILMDGWSMFRVLQRMFGAYDALRAGKALELSPPPPYRDYIVWLERQDMSRAEEFWRRNLAGFKAPTPLIEDPTATKAGDEDFATLVTELSEEATSALQEFSVRHRLTLNTVLQGAWGLMLSRYSRENDVLFGAVVSGRPASLAGVESMVGLLINSLPVRVEVPAQAPLISWLQGLQAEQAELREFEYSPLVEVHGWSDVPRANALFDSIFLFENYRKDKSLEEMCEAIELSDVRWYERHNYPLAALAVPGPELSLRLIYQTERFSAATIERMLGHWRTVLQGMVATPQVLLAELPLTTSDERQELLVRWNDTDTETSTECVQALFEAQVERDPAALAVADGDRSLTYGELERRSNQLAWRLRGLGAGPGEIVAICTGRCLEMVVGILATLKAGAAYLPLDFSYPPDRLAFMLDDAGAVAVLTRRALTDSLPEHNATTLSLDSEWDAIASESEARPDSSVHPEGLAYVIYTSGSTGRPKGVELEHRGLSNLVAWHQRTYNVTPQDRLTHLAGLAFDASVWELWPCLTAGASLHLVDDETRLMPEALVEWFAARGITQSFVPTPLAEALLRQDLPETLALQVMLTGGDKLHRAPDRELPFELVNHYGPTENSVVATAVSVPPALPGSRDGTEEEAPPIGRPIDNVQVYVLDPRGEPCPIGVAGELHIGGASLARGYHARPALTAERFVPHPFSSVPGSRLYATGDLARLRADGNVEFLGRMDWQVKIRGFRVELNEIEVALGRHPAVDEALVVLRDDGPGDGGLVAYVAGRADALPAAGELRDFLKRDLPDYMVPSTFVPLDALPRTPNGKLDRNALPDPPESATPAEGGYLAPRTRAESQVAEVWQEILGLERVGVRDNFFDLGGHSLLLMPMIAQLSKRLGVKLSPRDLVVPTLGQLAALCEEQLGLAPAEPAPPTRAPASGTGLQPFYFGPGLFGCLHPAGGGAEGAGPNDMGIVLCYPFGHEYIQFHRAFRQLAILLSEAGFPVLRFDFLGSGDSSGGEDDWRLDRWIEDIGVAAGELRARTGVSKIGLVGTRLGASLAALSAVGGEGLDALVLWDPVVNGTAYVDELHALHASMVSYAHVMPLAKAEPDEVLGFALPEALRQDLDQLDLLTLEGRPAPRALVIESHEDFAQEPLRSRLEALGLDVELQRFTNPHLWVWIEDFAKVHVPRQVLEAIVAWVAREERA